MEREVREGQWKERKGGTVEREVREGQWRER